MDSLLPIAIVAVLILLNGLFVAAEFAIVGVPRLSIERRARAGERVARTVKYVIDDLRRRDRYIATAQLGITISSLGLGMYGEHTLAEWLVHRLEVTGLGAWLSVHATASVIAITVLTYFHIVVGEMVPKSFALLHAERTTLAVTPPMLVVQTIWLPLVVALNAVGDWMLRLMGLAQQSGSSEQYYTPEELQAVIQESEHAGLIRGETGRLIADVLEFGDATAASVMVPRVRMAAIPIGAAPDALAARVTRATHTRYPVYAGTPDNVIWFIGVKDLYRLIVDGVALAEAHVAPMPIVPASTSLDHVLAAMKKDATPMALVVDEFGGTAGLVTLEDLFGELMPEPDEAGAPDARRPGPSR
jgi:CBS domain containing-hemolysin-like protein